MARKNSIEIENLLGEEITVNLKGGQEIEGTLTEFDEYMNLVLKNAKEHRKDGEVKDHELIIVKGGNIRAITS